MARLPEELTAAGPLPPPMVREPQDFRAFWDDTLAQTRQHPLSVRREAVRTPLSEIDYWDLTFAGFDGQPVRAWLSMPAHRSVDTALPVVVQVPGYGRGRGLPGENPHVGACGMAHLLMDVRGQGFGYGCGGDTPDLGGNGAGEAPGVLTRGILDPHTFYYRRLITDAVRAVEAVRFLDDIDSSRTFLMGNSQGGGVLIAVAGLMPDLAGVTVSVPFLCDIPAVYQRAQGEPYSELQRYLAVRRTDRERVFNTLSYVDGVNHARYATAPSLWALGLRDVTCPTLGGQQALAAWAGSAQVRLYPDNGHEGGEFHFLREQLAWLRALAGLEMG